MNVSNHAKMQWLKRTEGAYIINDSTFPTWCKCNNERVTQAEKDIQEAFKTRDYIIKGDYGSENNKGEVEYSICWGMKLIFISNKDTLITVYPLSYSGLGETASEKIFRVLIDEVEIARNDYKLYQDNYDIYKEHYDSIQFNFKTEQLYINSLQEALKARKEVVETENKAKLAELDVKKRAMQILEQKIVKPIQV